MLTVIPRWIEWGRRTIEKERLGGRRKIEKKRERGKKDG